MNRLDELVRAIEAILADARSGALPRDVEPFALTSLRFVAELVSRLEDGGFRDPAWVRQLALDADGLYLTAVRNPAARPGPWRVAMDTAATGSGRVMRNLLLGINAHIAFDLVVTLAVAIDDARVDAQRADFLRLNEIIATATDGVQAELEGAGPRWLFAADLGFGRLDERGTATMFRWLRSWAFDEALALRRGDVTRDDVERTSLRSAWALRFLPV